VKTIFVVWALSMLILIPFAKRSWPGRDVAGYLVIGMLFALSLALLVKVMRN